MTDKRYWIWLQLCLGQGAHFLPIIEEYGSVGRLYSADIIDWKMSPSLTAKQVDALAMHVLKEAERIIEICDENNYDIITFEDEAYPKKLRDITNPQ